MAAASYSQSPCLELVCSLQPVLAGLTAGAGPKVLSQVVCVLQFRRNGQPSCNLLRPVAAHDVQHGLPSNAVVMQVRRGDANSSMTRITARSLLPIGSYGTTNQNRAANCQCAPSTILNAMSAAYKASQIQNNHCVHTPLIAPRSCAACCSCPSHLLARPRRPRPQTGHPALSSWSQAAWATQCPCS